MYLITAYFDNETNKILQRYVDQVSKVTGNTFMTDNHVPPHLTITAIEAKSADVLLPTFRELEGCIKSGDIFIVSTGQLYPYVFYATPVLNEYLQGLQETVFDTFSGISETKISKYYQPYSWLPHITIGKKLSKEQMVKALSVMQDSFVPVKGTITEIGLAKVNPHEDIYRFRL